MWRGRSAGSGRKRHRVSALKSAVDLIISDLRARGLLPTSLSAALDDLAGKQSEFYHRITDGHASVPAAPLVPGRPVTSTPSGPFHQAVDEKAQLDFESYTSDATYFDREVLHNPVYAGDYVAVHGGRVIASGPELGVVIRDVLAAEDGKQRLASCVLERVPASDPVA
jgi:hypothetical protein